MNRIRLLRTVAMLPFMWSLVLSDATADGKALSQKDREMYRSIAYRIVDKLVASESDKYPDLVKLSSNKEAKDGRFKEESEDKFWIAYHYSHGMSWIPNPDHKSFEKGGKELKSFANDGVELNLYFYEGGWPGQAAVSPLEIGQMKIVLFIEGSQAAREAFSEVLRNNIEQEQRRFRKK
jgi:hypothetical protein